MRPRAMICWSLFLASAALADESGANSIRFTTVHVRAGKGDVYCAIYASAEGFPTKPALAKASARGVVRDGNAMCEFNGLAPGSYAISAYHDENGNGKLDTNFLGIPKEGLAASNDARGSMGPPKFKDAQFVFKGGTLELKARMNY